jgi:hypothetical protein
VEEDIRIMEIANDINEVKKAIDELQQKHDSCSVSSIKKVIAMRVMSHLSLVMNGWLETFHDDEEMVGFINQEMGRWCKNRVQFFKEDNI